MVIDLHAYIYRYLDNMMSCCICIYIFSHNINTVLRILLLVLGHFLFNLLHITPETLGRGLQNVVKM